ncbi:hypothetical protein F7P10_19145 [Actinomadura sp. WMMB 499]|nr:hypothetical protein F7P10_19145 [Actinomadura sp. WMMB 499]
MPIVITVGDKGALPFFLPAPGIPDVPFTLGTLPLIAPYALVGPRCSRTPRRRPRQWFPTASAPHRPPRGTSGPPDDPDIGKTAWSVLQPGASPVRAEAQRRRATHGEGHGGGEDPGRRPRGTLRRERGRNARR